MFLSPRILLDHVIIDGNRNNRLNTQAASDCITGNAGRAAGANSFAYSCNNCSFTNSIFMNALCGTGLGINSNYMTIAYTTFRGNGDHTNRVSDGLTVGSGTGISIFGCQFIDNSDIHLIIGSGRNAQIYGNVFAMQSAHAFGGFMMDNFNSTTDGNFNGLVFYQNTINCGAFQCSFGIEIGPHPWYLSSNIIGGTVTQNTVYGANVNINVYGGGTPTQPVGLYGNTIGTNIPQSWQSTCGTVPGSALNIATDSYVYRNGETFGYTTYSYHCP